MVLKLGTPLTNIATAAKEFILVDNIAIIAKVIMSASTSG